MSVDVDCCNCYRSAMATTLPDPLLMTAEEAAEVFRVSAYTVRAWARRGRLPRVKTPGGQVRFRRADVAALLEQVEGAA